MHAGTIAALSAYFLLMLGIGVYAFRTSSANSSEYLLSGRSLGPAVTALAAGASDMSGWLMMGLPGALYASGLAQAWIAIGLFIGALANWIIVAPRLREQTVAVGDALTIPEYLGKRFAAGGPLLRVVAALVIVVFFTLYSSAGLVAGGKLFVSAFGTGYDTGLIVTASVVVAYVVLGGFLAVSLTDFVQGTIMAMALVLVPLVAWYGLDAQVPLREAIRQVDPALMSFTAGTSLLGIVSALAWGLGYFGQPHIIVRFMAIRSVREIPTARNIGMSWMAITLIGAMATGIIGRLFAEAHPLLVVTDPETIFILLSRQLLSPLLLGFVLAAILAAIMSTISAQLLVTGSSLTEDFYRLIARQPPSDRRIVTVGRLSVIAVAMVALLLALNPDNSVLGLVAHAWAGFGAAFGPVILLALTWPRLTRDGALAGMITGALVVLLWIAYGLSDWLYEIVPGFAAAFATIVLVSLLRPAPVEERGVHV